jgi:hypothetical protein
LRRFLKEDLVAYGIVRLGFGSGKLRRTKHIFVSFCGSKAPIASRAKFAGAKGRMRLALGHAHMEMQASTPDELSLAAVIAKVKSSSVIDGDDVHTAEQTYNIDEFTKALREEAEAAGSYFGDSGDIGEDDDGEGGGSGIPIAQAVSDVRKGGTGVNWALFLANL